MKRISLLLFFLLTIFTLSAQDRLSVFLGRANRYANVELSDYRKRLCVEYGVSNRLLDNYYRLCGRDWGNVGIALEISKSSGRKMHDVCNYYKRYRRYGWDRVLIEIGLRPGSAHYHHFYDRIHHHSDCWHNYYNSYCERHDRYHHKHHKHHKYHKHHKHHNKYYRDYDDDGDDDDDDDDDDYDD